VEGVDVEVVEVLPSNDSDELGGSGLINWGSEVVDVVLGDSKSVDAGGGQRGNKEFVHFCLCKSFNLLS